MPLRREALVAERDNCPAALYEHLTHAVGHQRREVGDRLAAAFTDTMLADDDAFLTELRTRYQLTDEQSLTPLDQPVTFVAGRRDQIAGFRDQFAACMDCPRGDYVLFASAGHYLSAEVPAQSGILSPAGYVASCRSAPTG